MAAKVKEQPLVEEENLVDIGDEDLTSGKKNKKEKKEKKEKKKKAKSGSGAKIIIFIFVLLLIGAAVGIIGFNLFNIRDKYLASTIQNIPIVKNLVALPETDTPKVMTPEELEAKIKNLESQLDAAQKKISDNEKNLELKQAEVDRLKIFEDQQTEFKAEKDEFDRKVALNDPVEYSEYFEKISPSLAEELYTAAKTEAERQKEINLYLATINETDETSAAKILEQLIPTDLNLVVSILQRVNSKLSGAILGEMSAENGAAVLKRWDPLTY